MQLSTPSIAVTARIGDRDLKTIEVGSMDDALIVACDLADEYEPAYGTAVEVTIE